MARSVCRTPVIRDGLTVECGWTFTDDDREVVERRWQWHYGVTHRRGMPPGQAALRRSGRVVRATRGRPVDPGVGVIIELPRGS